MNTESHPPKFFQQLLKWFCHPDLYEELQGDLEESFLENVREHSYDFAVKRYKTEVLRLFRPSVIKQIRFSPLSKISPDMLQNYFKIAWRNLFRQKVYGIINIAGLALGLACVVLIALYVRRELSYDSFHEKADRIVRLTHIYSFVHGPWGPTMKEDYPEVEDATRLFKRQYTRVTTDEDKQFFETVYAAEQNFFEIFTFPFIEGNPVTALAAPNGMVLTESAAIRYFGRTDVMGRSIRTGRMMGHDSLVLQVTGVIEDVPDNAHFTFDQLIPFQVVETGSSSDLLKDWYHDWAYTYLLLKETEDVHKLNAKMSAFFERHKSETCTSCTAQPLLKARLHSKHLRRDIAPQGDINQVRIFSAVAILILLIACINFMNLATARASRRAKEVGVRKAIGALKNQLIGQFLIESFLLTLISVVLAITLVWLALPHFESLVGVSISPNNSEWTVVIIGLTALTILVSLLSGAYPAFILSRFKPVVSLKGKADGGRRSSLMRKGLVTLQFAVSIILIIGTLVVFNQLTFMKNRPLGFKKEQVLFINYGPRLEDKLDVIKQELLQHPGIEEVASTSQIMGSNAFN